MPEIELFEETCPASQETYSSVWQEADVCLEKTKHGRISRFARNWEQETQDLMQAFNEELTSKWNLIARLESLEKEVALLKDRCSLLEQLLPIPVMIQSLAPEPFELIKPVPVVVQRQGDDYIATFFDANLSASGETQVEAIWNLKDIIIGTFDILTITDEGELGPGPLQQKRILEQFIDKKT